MPLCPQSTTRVKPFICTMPMRLDSGWNQIQFNLSVSDSQADNHQARGDWGRTAGHPLHLASIAPVSLLLYSSDATPHDNNS